jgi:hypothetical protein
MMRADARRGNKAPANDGGLPAIRFAAYNQRATGDGKKMNAELSSRTLAVACRPLPVAPHQSSDDRITPVDARLMSL